MGNSPDTTKPNQSDTFLCEKISESANKQIKGIHVDDSQLPNTGIIVVGFECILSKFN
jgi:hypothetical protein